MAPGPNSRSPDQVRHEIETHRDQLAGAVDSLRRDLGAATDISGKMRRNLPAVAGAALGAGFLFAGGVGATMRLLFRRGR